MSQRRRSDGRFLDDSMRRVSRIVTVLAMHPATTEELRQITSAGRDSLRASLKALEGEGAISRRSDGRWTLNGAQGHGSGDDGRAATGEQRGLGEGDPARLPPRTLSSGSAHIVPTVAHDDE